MKTSMLVLLLAALVPLAAPAADELTAVLQRGLFNEEAEHDLAAAIKAYQSVVAGADSQRKLAATAVFRLGECYRKLGQTNEAVLQYQRILEQFTDQTTLATLSRQNLLGLGVSKTSTARPGDAPSGGLLEAQLAAKQADAAEANALVQQLQALNSAALRRVLPTVAPDQLLNRLLDDMALTVARATEQSVNLAPDHPQLREKRDKIAALHTQIDERVDDILQGLKVKAGVLARQVEDMKRELANQPTARAAAGGRTAPTPSQVEAHRLLIERLQLEFKTTEAKLARQRELIRQGLSGQGSPEETEARLLDLRRQLVLATDSGPIGTADTAGAATDEEDREVRRIQALIKDSPDLVNAKSVEVGKYGEGVKYGTPLHRAAQQGQLVVARFLIDNGADLDSRDGFGRAPLHWAALNGHKSMAELLLARGADPDASISAGLSSAGFTPLHFAAQNGYRNVCEALLAGKADLNAKDSSEQTPLHLAANRGFASVAELLLTRGANANSGVPNGYTPLHSATGSGSKRVVELLLAHKADINAQNVQGDTPLYNAVSGNRGEVVRLLLAAKANPNLALNNKAQNPGWTPLVAAISRDDVPMARLLLENGADPNVLWYRNGYTVLMQAAHKGALELAEALIAAGADVNAKDNGDVRGTALHAVTSNNPTNAAAIVELLIKNKGDVNVANAYKSTPLIQAVDKRNLDVVKLLVEHGADVNAMTREGESPLSLIKPRRQQGVGFGVPGAFRSIPSRSAVVVPGQPNQPPPDPTSEIIALLTQRGARDDLRRYSAISTTRNQENRVVWFSKGTNDWNRYTLLDLIATMYQGETSYRFPDFSKIAISRIDAKTSRTEDIRIDLETAFKSKDCAQERPLEWGDIVEVPEQDHLISDSWGGLSRTAYLALQICLERNIRVVVKGQATNVVLTPFRDKNMPKTPLSEEKNTWEARMDRFRLTRFLRNSGLLLASSDVTRVKVKRIDPATNQVRERVFDLDQIQGQIQRGEDSNDLWLRDGDVIEVPEKDARRAAASPRADALDETFSIRLNFAPIDVNQSTVIDAAPAQFQVTPQPANDQSAPAAVVAPDNSPFRSIPSRSLRPPPEPK